MNAIVDIVQGLRRNEINLKYTAPDKCVRTEIQ